MHKMLCPNLLRNYVFVSFEIGSINKKILDF